MSHVHLIQRSEEGRSALIHDKDRSLGNLCAEIVQTHTDAVASDSRVEVVQDQGVIAKSNVLEVFCELVCQAVAHLTDVQEKTESAGDAVNNITRGADEESGT